MLISKGGTLLSIRDVKFDGAAVLDGQQRGQNLVTIHYQVLTKIFDPNETKHKYVVVKDNTLIVNTEFGDEFLAEMLRDVKNFAVKVLKESNIDDAKDIDAAESLIREQNPEKGNG